jgi:para-aminobenzoate synthetase component 1
MKSDPIRQAMSNAENAYRAEIVCSPITPGSRPDELLALLAPDDEPALLDSSARHPIYGRYSILACRPMEVLTLRDGVLRDRGQRMIAAGAEGVWAELGKALTPVAPVADDESLPYAPGWIGYVGYEVGRIIERLPGRAVRDTHLPDLHLAFYDAILVCDAAGGQAWLAELRFRDPAPPGAGAAAEKLRNILALSRSKGPPSSPSTGRASAVVCAGTPPRGRQGIRNHDLEPGNSRTGEPARVPEATPLPPASNFTPDQYRQAVARCIEYIAAGDIFQVNLSRRFEVPNAPDPRTTYRMLRACNPASYAAYIEFCQDDRLCAVLSSSPELFLRVRGRHVVTRPIKGTRGRCGDERTDAAARADLVACPKDNAELAMIVDLLRNDLGRICRYGSIRVAEPAALEAHPTVFHLVATVEGELRPDVDPASMLRATFPGGSITGAPKIRAMEIIDEMEDVARGVYTGCLGIVSADGACEWNIAIRTMVYDGGRVLIQAGGGIVADSNPNDEYHETLHKARAMVEALAMAEKDKNQITSTKRATSSK